MTNSRNKGYTLLELMLAIAISSIVITSVVALMGSVSRSYKVTNEKVFLQMEAQTILNQLNQMIMESTNVVCSDIDGDSDNDLKIYNNDKEYTITINFDSVAKKLLFTKVNKVPKMGAPTNELFGQYVTEFVVNPSANAGDSFTIELTLEQGDNTYSIENQVKIRNKIKPVEDY